MSFQVKIWDHCRYVQKKAEPYDEMARHLEACRKAGITTSIIYLPEVISLDDYCRAAAAVGITVEARIFPAWNNPAPVLRTLPEAKWREMEERFGIKLQGTCLNHPDNRKFFAEAIAGLVEAYASRLAAVHLDFIRNDNALLLLAYPCECEGCRALRHHYFGQETLPAEYRENPAILYKELEFRNRNVRETVRAAKALTENAHLRLTMAARANYLNEPDITAPPVWGLGPAVCEGQDWADWLADDLVDAVYPMNYHTDPVLFKQLLTDYIRLTGSKSNRLFSGIGVDSSMGQLTNAGLEHHLAAVRTAGLPGAVLFNKTNLYTPEQFAIIKASTN